MDIDIDELNDDNDESNLQISPAELIDLMEEIWQNERFSPEIMPHKTDVVDCVLEQITYMEKNLESIPSSDFRKGIHQLEVDRIRYLVTSYLRNRLEKIEHYCVDILHRERDRVEKELDLYLTESELQFAKNYKEGIDQHFHRVTSALPNLPLRDWREQPVIHPNLNSFVFIKSKSEIEGIVIDVGKKNESDVVDLVRDSQIIISYKSVANIIRNNGAKLI